MEQREDFLWSAFQDFDTEEDGGYSESLKDNKDIDFQQIPRETFSHIEWIKSNGKEMIERDYHGRRYSSYDFYFKIKNDDYIYAAETNIRMNKLIHNKWYWGLERSKSRLYKILEIDDVEKLYINAYPVDDNNEKMDWDIDLWLPKEFFFDNEGNEEELSLEDDGMDNDRYYNTYYYPPYTNVEFLDPIPEGGIELTIPEKVDENTSVHELIAVHLTQKPSYWFSSGK